MDFWVDDNDPMLWLKEYELWTWNPKNNNKDKINYKSISNTLMTKHL